MQQTKEAYIRRNIVLWGLLARVLIVIAAIIFYVFDYLADEFYELMYILLPITCLYLTFLTKFVIKNRYQKEGQVLGNAYVAFGYTALLLLNLGQLSLICIKSIKIEFMRDDYFFLLVALFESGFGLYVGLYLTDLFSVNAGRTNN